MGDIRVVLNRVVILLYLPKVVSSSPKAHTSCFRPIPTIHVWCTTQQMNQQRLTYSKHICCAILWERQKLSRRKWFSTRYLYKYAENKFVYWDVDEQVHNGVRLATRTLFQVSICPKSSFFTSDPWIFLTFKQVNMFAIFVDDGVCQHSTLLDLFAFPSHQNCQSCRPIYLDFQNAFEIGGARYNWERKQVAP